MRPRTHLGHVWVDDQRLQSSEPNMPASWRGKREISGTFEYTGTLADQGFITGIFTAEDGNQFEATDAAVAEDCDSWLFSAEEQQLLELVEAGKLTREELSELYQQVNRGEFSDLESVLVNNP